MKEGIGRRYTVEIIQCLDRHKHEIDSIIRVKFFSTHRKFIESSAFELCFFDNFFPHESSQHWKLNESEVHHLHIKQHTKKWTFKVAKSRKKNSCGKGFCQYTQQKKTFSVDPQAPLLKFINWKRFTLCEIELERENSQTSCHHECKLDTKC